MYWLQSLHVSAGDLIQETSGAHSWISSFYSSVCCPSPYGSEGSKSSQHLWITHWAKCSILLSLKRARWGGKQEWTPCARLAWDSWCYCTAGMWNGKFYTGLCRRMSISTSWIEHHEQSQIHMHFGLILAKIVHEFWHDSSLYISILGVIQYDI